MKKNKIDIEKLQENLDKKYKERAKKYKNKTNISIGKGETNFKGTGLLSQKAILKKTRAYLRVGKMNGEVK